MSAETKFSPGPWHPGHLGNPDLKCECRYILDEGHCGGIGEVYVNNGKPISEGGNDAPDYAEAVANMHLMAAAPDLYAALDLCATDLKKVLDARGYCDDPAVLAAFATLAKARGETP